MHSHSERIFNSVTGLMIFSWGVVGIVSDLNTSLPIVRFCTSTLNMVIGFIFIIRHPLKKDGSVKNIILSFPSFLATGAAFKLSYEFGQWSILSNTFFILGTTVTLISFFFLRKSFAILPAVRETITKGPYHVVRHPAYLGELLMVMGCFSSAPLIVGFPFAIVILTVILRILVEEDTLLQDNKYRIYYQKTTWRLIPHIW